jgi:CSLREA domain-containing protein
MRRHVSPFILPMLAVLAACGDDSPPTAPAPGGISADAVTAASARVVNSLADPGDGACDARECTLREAIGAAGTTAISFAPGLAGTITLADPSRQGGPLSITTSLTITAPAAGVSIRRRSTDAPFRILRVGQGAVVTLTNLTLRNGRTDLQGAGLINFGRLTLVGCAVTGNTSTTLGGGIENKAVLALTRTTVSNNTGSRAAGIDNDDARLIVTNSVIARNNGYGIFNRGGSLKLVDSRVSDNTALGIWEEWAGSTLNHARITGNRGGGYAATQTVSLISRSTIAGNSGADGAGIGGFIGADITVSKSTIAGNTASGRGGAIFVADDNAGRVRTSITLVNSTVTGNTAESGGAIAVRDRGMASISVENSTIAANSARVSGGGAFGFGFEGPVARFANSIVAGNTAPVGPDLSGDFVARFSLIGDGAGTGIGNTDGNLVGRVPPNSGPIDPRLGPLADNGGPTRTLALLADSPAIDAASADGCPGKDQRDVVRPRGAACDMGSFER